VSGEKQGGIFLVDPDSETWNTFIEIMFEWAPKLKQIYEPAESGTIDRSG